MKIITVIGARPQFVKAAVLSRAIRAYNLKHDAIIEEITIHTGQHYDENMSQIFFDELEIPKPQYNLNVGVNNHNKSSTAIQLANMMVGIEEILLLEKPDIVYIYGDTNSTLSAAIVASKLRIPIAHVEAGVRNYDMKNMEEQNRIIADHVSNVLFCPTENAVKCLELEGIYHGLKRGSEVVKVFNTGDVMYDAYLYEKKKLKDCPFDLSNYDMEKKAFILLTIHRDENTSAERLKAIIEALGRLDSKVLFPIHPRTRKVIVNNNLILPSNIFVIDPLGYKEMLCAQELAQLIITDSGGLQKEAFFSKTPCLTVMSQSGWIETVESGWNVLMGESLDFQTEIDKILVSSKSHKDYFGNGSSGEIIINHLLESLGENL